MPRLYSEISKHRVFVLSTEATNANMVDSSNINICKHPFHVESIVLIAKRASNQIRWHRWTVCSQQVKIRFRDSCGWKCRINVTCIRFWSSLRWDLKTRKLSWFPKKKKRKSSVDLKCKFSSLLAISKILWKKNAWKI